MQSKFINLSKNKILYSSSNNKYDIIIIRLLDNEIEHYLKIDENIFENSEKEYKDEPIYILHYPGKDEKAKVSYSEKGIEKINEYDIKHYCNTEEGSSGSPILSSMTNKIIGIHKAANRKRGYNFGSFLKYPLSELKGNKNEIICIYNKQEDEIKLLYDYTDNIISDDDYERKKSYIEAFRKISIEEREHDCYYGASTLILVYGPRDDRFTIQDASCMLENMFIASEALGLGSCWINRSDEYLNTPNGKKLRKKLGLKESDFVVGTCIVGYINGDKPEVKPRREDLIRII